MSALAIRWCIGLAVLAGLMVSSFVAGDNYRDNAWLAKQATAERAADKKYVAEVERGSAAAGAFIVEHQTMQSDFQNLTEKFNGLSKRVPLLVGDSRRAACSRANQVAGNTVGPRSGEPESLEGGQPAVDGAVLTAGAVWMWNSALTGTDKPSGACGALDTSPAACAAATSLTTADAWDNHTFNAQLCAEDRLAHNRLIDFLKGKP